MLTCNDLDNNFKNSTLLFQDSKYWVGNKKVQERKNMEAATLLEGSMMSMERKTAEFFAFKAKEDAYVIRQKEAKMRDLQMKAKLQACSAEAEKVRERLGLQYLSRKKQDEFRLQRELKDRERKLIQTKIKQCFFDTCACMGSDDSSTDSESCDSEKGQDGQCFCSEEKNERWLFPPKKKLINRQI